jgi:hypothetical protein
MPQTRDEKRINGDTPTNERTRGLLANGRQQNRTLEWLVMLVERAGRFFCGGEPCIGRSEQLRTPFDDISRRGCGVRA